MPPNLDNGRLSVPSSAVSATPAESTIFKPSRGALWSKRLLKLALIVVVLIALLLGATARLVPYVLSSAAPNWLKQKTGRELSFKEVSFNPFTLRLQASGIAPNKAAKPLASFASIEVKSSWATLTQFAWTADNVTLTKPEITARIVRDGSLDRVRFLDAIPKSTELPSDKMPPIVMHHVVIEHGSILFNDERADARGKAMRALAADVQVRRAVHTC